MSTVIGTQTISRNPANESDFWHERLQHDTIITADGGRSTYDSGPTVLHGILVIRNISKAEADAFRTWLTATAIFQKNSFSITPPSGVDLGSGDATAVTSAYYNGPTDLKDVIVPQNPRTLYTINFPYWKLVS